MKRLIIAAIAAASLAGPMVVASSADAQYYGRDRDYNNRYYGDRDRDGRPDASPYDRYDNRNGARWDDRRYNGYYYNGRWFYGPPPRAYYRNPGLRLGWRNWERGTRMPGYYNRGYVVNDWRAYGLHRPPAGYEWRRVGNDYILVAVATGLIAEIMRH